MGNKKSFIKNTQFKLNMPLNINISIKKAISHKITCYPIHVDGLVVVLTRKKKS